MKIDVTITNDDGQSFTLSQGFDFQEPVKPPPRIVGISPASGGAGALVTLFGSDFQPGAQVTFGGVPANSIVVSPDGLSLTCVVPTL